MAFHEIRFPTAISLGSKGGPERRTRIVALSSGHEERNTSWANSRRRYNAGYGLKSLDDIHELIAFFEERRGRLHGFRWKDGADCRSCPPLQAAAATDQLLGTGDGAQDAFQLVKHYGTGSTVWTRQIAKPVAGSVLVAVDGAVKAEGADYAVDAATGVISFAPGAVPANGAAVTAGFSFDVPVRFDTDQLEIDLDAFGAGAVPDIPVVEVLL